MDNKPATQQGVMHAAASRHSGTAHNRSLHSRRRSSCWARPLAAPRVQLEAHLKGRIRLGRTSRELTFGNRWTSPPPPAGSRVLRSHRCLAAWLRRLAWGPPEVTVPYGCAVSARAGMSIRHGTLTDTDVVELRGLPATSPLRTAFDLSRRLPLVDAVAAVDAALHNRTVELAEFRSYVVEHSRCAGVAQARRVAELADACAESPMETRLRMLLVLAGLPPPWAQVPLYDDRGQDTVSGKGANPPP